MALTVSGMAAEIEKAMGFEWQNTKGTALPEAGKEDRQMLFQAISRGILSYLLSQQTTAAKDITLSDGSVSPHKYTVDSLTLNITIDA